MAYTKVLEAFSFGVQVQVLSRLPFGSVVEFGLKQDFAKVSII